MSSDVVIRIEGLSKRYLMSRRGASFAEQTLSHFKEFVPFLRQPDEDYFWALKDMNLEVRAGEILGIVGPNGSGKSTLLKILSGVTRPTVGRVWMKGRVGSLLEVGTGFHPEMTGRENIYFAGALLGMSQTQIRDKFDEIVDFSGIEEFIDMPVKRYSSGMYVRLAYSVASLLRSDILILDEVMAVGDAAFREKSQKNIEKAAHDGRTILFVSHNVQALKSLCHSGILMEKGEKLLAGDIAVVTARYMERVQKLSPVEGDQADAPVRDISSEERFSEHDKFILQRIELRDARDELTNAIRAGDALKIRIRSKANPIEKPYFVILILNEFSERVMTIYSTQDYFSPSRDNLNVECTVEHVPLVPGRYRIMLDFGTVSMGRFESLDCVPNAAALEVEAPEEIGPPRLVSQQGYVLQKSKWRELKD